MIEHKKTCSEINGKQTVKLRSSSVKFKNYFKQLAVPFKIYANFESLLKGIKSSEKNNTSYTRKYQAHILCSFPYKIEYNDDKFSNRVVLYRGKDAVDRFIKAILEEYYYWKNVIKRYIN